MASPSRNRHQSAVPLSCLLGKRTFLLQEVGAAVGLLGDYLDLIVVPMVLQKPSLREEALQCPCKRCSNSLKVSS